MVDDPTSPFLKGSCTSSISVFINVKSSRPIFPSVPEKIPKTLANSEKRSREGCQEMLGTAKPNSFKTAFSTSHPLPKNEA